MYAVVGGDDDGSHPVAHEDAEGDADLQEGEPHGLLVASVLVDPDGVVDKQEDLTDPGDEPSAVGGNLVLNEHEKQ